MADHERDRIIDAAMTQVGDELPFDWYQMGPAQDELGLELSVSPDDLAQADTYFARHPVVVEGQRVDVHLLAVRGGGFTVEPEGGPAWKPTGIPRESLIGLDVDVAAERAVAAGWRVRAVEPQAIMTADAQSNRLNLTYDEERVVTDVDRG